MSYIVGTYYWDVFLGLSIIEGVHYRVYLLNECLLERLSMIGFCYKGF